MALAIDGSSPAIVTGAGPTLTSASFTPPAGSVLLVSFTGDSNSGEDVAQPTITDNLGTPLTYKLVAFHNPVDTPAANGQAAMWHATVGVSVSMTVSVTSQSPATAGALQVQVWTGAAPTTPIGASGHGSAAGGVSAVTQAYTAQASGGQGVIAVCDWYTTGPQTAGTGCTVDGSATVGTNITYCFARRTADDDVNGASNTLATTLPSASTAVGWVYAEMQPISVDPNVADPPPFISYYTPGSMAPNGRLVPWLGGGALPVSPVLHGSTPGAVFAITNPHVTASFTPPAGSTLIVGWAGDGNVGEDVAQPTITDSLGTHLTYNLIAFRNHADSPAVDGQAAMWWANVPTTPAVAMTVTVTSQSTAQAGAVKVWVYTGADLLAPIGTSGKAGSTSATSITQNYAALSDGGQGLLVACDVSNSQTTPITAGTDCTLDDVSLAASANIDWAFGRRTKADDALGRTMTLRLNLPNTSTALHWIWAEVRAGTPAQVPPAIMFQPARGRWGWDRPRVRGRLGVGPVPAQTAATAPTYPPVGLRERVKMVRAARPRAVQPAPAQDAIAQPVQVRARTAPVRRRRATTTVPPEQPGIWQSLRAKLRLVRVPRARAANPVPVQVAVTAPTYPPQSVRTRVRGARPPRGHTAAPVPTQIVVAPPSYVSPPAHARVRSLWVFRRPRVAAPVPTQSAPSVFVRLRSQLTRLLLRGRTRPIVPAQTAVTPPQPAHTRRAMFDRRRRRAGVEGWMSAGVHTCSTARPDTGTTARLGTGTTLYATATTARPDTGVTTRPDTGQTESPC